MENTRKATAPFDPQADLELLKRSRSSVAINDALDFGPWWYAPLLATFVGGLAIASENMTGSSYILYGLVAIIAGIAVLTHDYDRRTVRPKFSVTAALIQVAMVIFMWTFIDYLWTAAITAIGYDDFVPGPAVLAWVTTTAIFLALRAVCTAALKRRSVMAS